MRSKARCLLVILLFGLAAPISSTAADKTVVAVLWKTEDGQVQILAPLVEQALMKQKGIDLVDRENIDRIMLEKSRVMGGFTSAGRSIELGRLLAADIIVDCESSQAPAPDSGELRVSALHIRVYEVASSVKLVDISHALIGSHNDQMISNIASAILKGCSKYPVSAEGMLKVSISEPNYATCDRSLFPEASAYKNLLTSMLLKSDRIAILERRKLGGSRLERFFEDMPLPKSANVTITPHLSKNESGQTVLRTAVSLSEEHELPLLVYPVMTADHVKKQAEEILEVLEKGDVKLDWEDGLKSESRKLFSQAYTAARHERYDESYEIVQAALILHPEHLNAHILARRMHAEQLGEASRGWSKVNAAAKPYLLEQIDEYIEAYHKRQMQWFEEEYETLVGGMEAMSFGDLTGGYELGPEAVFGMQCERLENGRFKALLLKKKREFGKFYIDLIERTGDRRLLHRPKISGIPGPTSVYDYLTGVDDEDAFFKIVRRCYAYETGGLKGRPEIAAYVKGYSVCANKSANMLAERFADGRFKDWAKLDRLLRHLEQSDDLLGRLWMTTIIDRTWDKMPASIQPKRARARIRAERIVAALNVADGMNVDGCNDRIHKRKSDMISSNTRDVWPHLTVAAAMDIWRQRTEMSSEVISSVTPRLMSVVEKTDKEKALCIGQDALRIVPPGANGYSKIVAEYQRLRRAAGETLPKALCREGSCVFDSKESGLSGAMGALCQKNGKVCFVDGNLKEAYRIDLATGKLDRCIFSCGEFKRRVNYIGLRAKGALCNGRYYFSPISGGIIEVDWKTGKTTYYTTRNGLYSMRVRGLTSVNDKLYGIAYSKLKPRSSCWSLGRKAMSMLFELDPGTGKITNIEGTEKGAGRLKGARSLSWRGMIGDEHRNGLWLDEAWFSLGFPHFYDLTTRQWTRIRINAFDWQRLTSGGGLQFCDGDVLFGSFLYEPDKDAFSYLYPFAHNVTNEMQERVVDIGHPVTVWKGQVWGKSSNGTLATVSRDGRRTLYGGGLLPEGCKIETFLRSEKDLIAVVRNKASLQFWKLRPHRSEERVAIADKPRSEIATAKTTKVNSSKPVKYGDKKLNGLMVIDQPEKPDTSLLSKGSETARQRQLECAAKSGLPVETENSAGIRFRLIPAGDFIMGNARAHKNFALYRATRLRPVTFDSAKYVSSCEITQKQWKQVMGENPIKFGEHRDRLPIEEITWGMCQKFLAALCKQEKLPVGTYRLPSEAEWEYMCRAGTDTLSCYGDDYNRTQVLMRSPTGVYPYCLKKNNANDWRMPDVGSYPANAWGLHDMHGSVAEWCQDLYISKYPTNAVVNPVQLTKGEQRVYRGGNRCNPIWDCSSYFCDYARVPPNVRARGFGFRIVRELVGDVE